MRTLFAGLALLTAMAAPVRGQQAATAATHAAAAGELVDLMRLGERAMPDMGGLAAGFAGDNPMVAQMTALATEFYKEYLPWEKVRPEFVSIYQTTFTESEIRQLIAFYRTPIGQKLIEKEPEMMKATLAVTQKLLMPHMMELQQRIMTRMGGGGRP